MNHEMYLPKVTKNRLSAFDEKLNYLNNLENIPWE